jgi:hypothetical protein
MKAPPPGAPSLGDFIKDFAFTLRKAAEDTGTDCDMPKCNALTLGMRCANCSRRLCNGHAFVNFSGGRFTSYCIYCAVALNQNMFGDADDDEEEEVLG